MSGQGELVMQALLALRSEGWPAKGNIVAVCSLVRNYQLFGKIGGDDCNVVMLDHFLAKLMVQAIVP